MKKIIISIFALLFYSSLLIAQSEDSFQVSQLRDGTLAITGINGGSGNLIIPSKLFGYNVSKVEGINSYWAIRGGFSNIDNLTITNGIIEIGDGAFQHNLSYMNRSGLINISLPNGLKRIGQSAFMQAIPGILSLEPDPLEKVHIKSIILPRTLEYVGQRAFEAIDIDYLKIESAFTVERPTNSNRSPIFNQGRIMCIELIGNLSDQWLNLVFEDQNFINFYLSQSRREGIYLYNGRLWTIGTRQSVNQILDNNNTSLNETRRIDTNEGTTRSDSFQREHTEAYGQHEQILPNGLVLPSGETVRERTESGNIGGK
ncbi:MAG: leucine-rich repeat domain-containing protein [Treponema sp.]|jgi:hypothetical protein|nr:leucine-rich repeat domain-containing protein [Treponema sp.]